MPLLPTEIATRRLGLRRYRPDDAGWYAEMALRNRVHLTRYESGNAAMRIDTREEAEAAIAEFTAMAESDKAVFLAAFRIKDGAFVGQIYVGVSNAALPGYVIGYFCDVDHLRQGYVGEAAAATVAALFESCGAERVGLGCDDTNIASRKIARRLGMRREGHIRTDKRNPDGSVTGSLLFGLLRAEFFAHRAATADKGLPIRPSL